MFSGDRPDLYHPKWFNEATARELYEYAPMYKEYWSGMNGVKGRHGDLLRTYGMPTTTNLKEWGRRALEVRDDQWRMRLGIAPRWGHLKKVGTENGMDIYTDPKGIEQLGYMPKLNEYIDPADFINSSGGNVGLPKINWLGNGIAEKGTVGKKFGIAEINDKIDYYPFSRKSDQLIARLQQHVKDPLGRNFSYLKRLNEKVKNIELASIFGKNMLGAKPVFKMQYKIPFTQDYTGLTGDMLTTKGFNSTNTLPWQVEEYLTTGYDPSITKNIINSIDFSKILKSNKSIKTK